MTTSSYEMLQTDDSLNDTSKDNEINEHLTSADNTKTNQKTKTKTSSITRKSMPKNVKLEQPPIRRLRKRLATILDAMNHCQTLKKKKSKRRSHCEKRLKKYILKFVETASVNRFRYIF